MSDPKKNISRKKILQLLNSLYFYYINADFPRLKALFQATLILVMTFLRADELNETWFERIQNFIDFEKDQPPHAAPLNDEEKLQ